MVFLVIEVPSQGATDQVDEFFDFLVRHSLTKDGHEFVVGELLQVNRESEASSVARSLPKPTSPVYFSTNWWL